MASYEAWNFALATYFISGASKGAPIFLSLDEEAIEEIAINFLDESIHNPIEDFLSAVRSYCVSLGGGVNLYKLKTQIQDLPGGIGFLGLMVYSAYQMHDEEGIDDTNYFLRLRESLGLPVVQGRPEGMQPAGVEESLWRAWNHFIMDLGFEKTAERGSGPQTYLRYIISQTILRKSDKDYLCALYKERNAPLRLDCDQLGFWLSRQHVTRKHLAEGLEHPDASRVWEFYQASHRVYESQAWLNGAMDNAHRGGQKTRNIHCGLYREVDLAAQVKYHLFPKQPERHRISELSVVDNDNNELSLKLLRPGFFYPLWVQSPFVNDPIEYQVHGSPQINTLLFPNRQFWILTMDPENPHGMWASWKPYHELGEKLLILCRRGEYEQEMERLKDAKLIDWSEQQQTTEWVEYYNCMILSYDWGGYIPSPNCTALTDSLAPRSIAGITFKEGLRVPNLNAWIEGFPPVIRIYGFENSFIIVVKSSYDEIVFNEEVSCQDDIQLPIDLISGTYQLEVKSGSKKVATRILRMIYWEDVQPCSEPKEIINSNPISTAGLCVRGALLLEDAVRSNEELYG